MATLCLYLSVMNSRRPRVCGAHGTLRGFSWLEKVRKASGLTVLGSSPVFRERPMVLL